MKQNYSKSINIFVVAAYIILTYLSVFYYKERFHSDTCYYFFKVVNTKFFWIELGRITQIFMELPIVIGANLNIPLKILMYIFSVWHYLFFIVIGGIVLFKYKNSYAFLLLLCLQVVAINYGFVCPSFEMYYAFGITVLYYLVLDAANLNFKNLIFLLGLGLLIALGHPNNLLILLFIHVFQFLKNKKLIVVLTIILVAFYLFVKYLFPNEYETNKMNWIFNLKENKHYLNLYDLSYWKDVFGVYFKHYLLVMIFFVISLVYYFKTKQLYKFIVLMSFVVLLVLFINFSYDNRDWSGYMEQVRFVLIPAVFFPFILDVLPYLKMNFKVQLLCWSLIFFANLFSIIKYANFHKEKTMFLEQKIQLAQQQNGSKFFLNKKDYEIYSTRLGWEIPFYTILLSSMHYNKTVTIVPQEDLLFSELENVDSNKYLFRYGEIETLESLNKNYFNLNDDEYVIMGANL